MALSDEALKDYMSQIGGTAEENFKMLLYYGDIGGHFKSDEEWGELCDFALRLDKENDFTQSWIEAYKSAPGPAELFRLIDNDMRNNYILSAFTLIRHSVPQALPVIAFNAFNKHSYPGLRDEFAVIRLLHWAGCDVNAVDGESGMTALHYMASLKYQPGTNPRAVDWLVRHGANANARNKRGDTPLTYLSATIRWSSAHTSSFVSLLNDGEADPFLPSDDGLTAHQLLKQLNEREFHEERQSIIDQLDEMAD